MFGQIIIYFFAILMVAGLFSFKSLKKKDVFENSVNAKGFGSLMILSSMLTYMALAFMGSSNSIIFTLVCLILALMLSFTNTIASFKIKNSVKRADFAFKLQSVAFVGFIVLAIASYIV